MKTVARTTSAKCWPLYSWTELLPNKLNATIPSWYFSSLNELLKNFSKFPLNCAYNTLEIDIGMFRSPAKPLKNADWARSNDNYKKTQRNILKLYLFTYSVQNFHSIPFYRERADVLSFRAENVKSKHFRSRAHDSSITEPFQWET